MCLQNCFITILSFVVEHAMVLRTSHILHFRNNIITRNERFSEFQMRHISYIIRLFHFLDQVWVRMVLNLNKFRSHSNKFKRMQNLISLPFWLTTINPIGQPFITLC